MAKKTLPPEIPAARWLPLRDLRPNPENPRVIRDDAFAKLVEKLLLERLPTAYLK